MKPLKFSYDYDKLPENWEGTHAILLGLHKVEGMEEFRKSCPQFIEYDTKIRNSSEHYPLGFKEGLILFFFHLNSSKLFTTIRRYTPSKYTYYNDSIMETFVLARA